MFIGINNLIVNVSEINYLKKCSGDRIELYMKNDTKFIVESFYSPEDPIPFSVSMEVLKLITSASTVNSVRSLSENSINHDQISIIYGKTYDLIVEFKSL